jgi:syntaxin 5
VYSIVAKRKSLFDDKSVEIQELTFIIKEDINSLNKNIARVSWYFSNAVLDNSRLYYKLNAFYSSTQLQGTARGSQTQNGKHMQSHSAGVVVGLQSKLASMSSEFKQVLQVRTEVRSPFSCDVILINPNRYPASPRYKIYIFL